MDDTNELTYPLFHKNMRVVPYDPECFMDCFFSPAFKHNDNIRKWVVLQYKTSGANTLKELQEGKVVFFYSFCKEKALNKQIMKYIDVINQEMNGDYTPNNYNAFCIDKKNGYLFALKEEELFIVNQKNKVYGCFLKDIVMQSQTVRKRNGDIIIGSCDLDPQFVEFSRDIKFLQEDIDLTDTFHPQSERKQQEREAYYRVLCAQSMYKEYLLSDEVIRLEMIARQIGISSEIAIRYLKKAGEKKKDKAYITDSLKYADELNQQSRYYLIHDLEVMDSFNCELKSMSEYTKAYAEKYQFNQKDIENNIQVIKKYNQLGENTRGFLYEMQLQIGQRKIAGIMKETVEFDLQNNKIGG